MPGDRATTENMRLMNLEEEFEGLLACYEPFIQALAHEVRALVGSVHPSAHQEVHAGWGGYLLFKLGSATGNTVCHLSAHKKHVSLGLAQGATLPDPAGLMEGGGKHSRHVKIKSHADVKRPELRALLQAAWAAQPDGKVLDAALERVRQICLAMPETSETTSHGHPTFWVGKKTFAVFGLYSPSVAFKAGFELIASLEEDSRFSPTPYMAQAGFISMRLDETTDWDLARELLEGSYRRVFTDKIRGTAKKSRRLR